MATYKLLKRDHYQGNINIPNKKFDNDFKNTVTLPPLGGTGYIAGEFPGIVTVDGAPAAAEVRVYWRAPNDTDSDGILIAKTMSSVTGEYRIDGLNPNLRYDVVARLNGYNDVIASNITPIAVPEPLVLMPVTAPLVILDTPINFKFIAYGGSGQYQFSVLNGTLPTGLSLDANGNLTGVCTENDTFTFTITVFDGELNSTYREYDVIVESIQIDTWTYAEYETWALSQPHILDIVPWGTVNGHTLRNLQLVGQSGNYIYTATVYDAPFNVGSTMYGSPAAPNQRVTDDSQINCVLRHCLEEATANSTGYGGHGNVFIFNTEYCLSDGNQYFGITKNGHTSSDWNYPYYGTRYLSCTYWDVALGKPRVYNCTTDTYSDLSK